MCIILGMVAKVSKGEGAMVLLVLSFLPPSSHARLITRYPGYAFNGLSYWVFCIE